MGVDVGGGGHAPPFRLSRKVGDGECWRPGLMCNLM